MDLHDNEQTLSFADALRKIIERGNPDELQLAAKYLENPYYYWQPRPDQPEKYENQTSFIYDRFPGLAVILGGRGSGKSEAGAYKLARNIFTTEPPKDLCKIFIVAPTFDQASGLWEEKLQHFIPPKFVQKFEWLSEAKCKPKSVILHPLEGHNGKRWEILFRSSVQGRASYAGYSNVAGFWADEPVPMEIIDELWSRCRESLLPGFKFWTMTPLDVGREFKEVFYQAEDHPDWKFYRLNSEENKALRDTTFINNATPEMREVITIGSLFNVSGACFKLFNPRVHVIKPCDIPENSQHYRVIDFGWNHLTAVIWAAKSRDGRWFIYDEWGDKNLLIEEKVAKILEKPFPATGITLADNAQAQERQEFAKRGIPNSPANKDKNSVNISVEYVSQLLQVKDGKPSLYIFNNCRRLIQQIQEYHYPVEKDTNSKYAINRPEMQDNPVKQNDDFVDCLRMLIYTTTREGLKAWGSAVAANAARRR